MPTNTRKAYRYEERDDATGHRPRGYVYGPGDERITAVDLPAPGQPAPVASYTLPGLVDLLNRAYEHGLHEPVPPAEVEVSLTVDEIQALRCGDRGSAPGVSAIEKLGDAIDSLIVQF